MDWDERLVRPCKIHIANVEMQLMLCMNVNLGFEIKCKESNMVIGEISIEYALDAMHECEFRF